MKLPSPSASKSSGDFSKPEPGNQPARLTAIVDLGTITTSFQGKEKLTTEVYFAWELVTQPLPDEKSNHLVGRTYTLSMDEKSNLRKMLTKWRGSPFRDDEEFELSLILGKPCLLDVQLTDKGYVKLDPLCVSKLPKGMACPAAVMKPYLWEISRNDKLPPCLNALPYIYGVPVPQRIQQSQEWKVKGSRQAPAPATPDDYEDAPMDEIPF